MVLVTESLPQFQSLSIGIWVGAGTRHERPGEEGLSHFLEHMMFKGTQKRSALDIAIEVDRVGGEFNAFTAREYTCFHLLLLSRDLKLAVDIMSDVLLNSAFAEEEIERERKVILQEISMVEDNPEELVHDVFFDQAFGGHPLGKPILGSAKTVASFDRATVYDYFRRHYTPRQMIVSVAGDVDHDTVKKLLNRALAGAKGLGGKAKRPERAPKPRAVTKVLRRDLEQAHLVAGFPAIPYDHPDRFAAFLLNIYLGGGMSSSLFQEIREKRGLAYTIYSSLAPFSDSGLFSFYVGTSPGEAGVCLEIMGKELAKLRKRPLPKEAVKILKDNLKSTILLNSDSVENRMTAIARNELFFGKYFSPRDTERKIEAVTAEKVQKMAHEIIRPDRLILTVMGPGVSSKLVEKIRRPLVN